MSQHHVKINGVTYTPRVHRYGGPDTEYARRVLEAPKGSAERAEGFAHFEDLYRVRAMVGPKPHDAELAEFYAAHGEIYSPGSEAKVRRVTFQIIRSLATRDSRLMRARQEAHEAQVRARRIAECRRWGCCEV